MDAQRQAEIVGLGLRQMTAHRQATVLVIDQHRHAEGERREALPLALRDTTQGRILDQHWEIPDLQIAQVETIDPRELQAAQPHFADARAQRVGDRADAGALRGVARDHRLLGAGVQDEILIASAVDLRLHDDLVVDEAERHRVRLLEIVLVDLDGVPPLERLQELHLRARPRGLVAAVLVRQQVDEVVVGVGRLVEAMHPLVDGANLRVDLAVARRHRGRRLRLGQRFIEFAARGQRSRQPEARA